MCPFFLADFQAAPTKNEFPAPNEVLEDTAMKDNLGQAG